MAPVTTTSGLDYNEFDTALEYLQDIVEMPAFYHNNLLDQDWVDKHIPAVVQKAPAVRALEWGTTIDTTSPATIGAKFTPHKTAPNVAALFTYVTGTDAAPACDNTRCGKIFAECVVADARLAPHMTFGLRSACTSCMFNHNSSRCSLYAARA